MTFMLIARKHKMTQIWKENTVIPVTVLKAEPNNVAIIRTSEKDGYTALQLQSGKARKEFGKKDKTLDISKFKTGDELAVDFFAEGDTVAVSGTVKGRGFQGTVKRHGFGGGPKTHGQKNRFRAPGSIGSTAFQRVVPGRRMAGHMGTNRVTVKNLKVVGVDKEKGILFLRGAVPGARGGVVEIVKIKNQKSK
ncbi:MAG: 50S ribosomal protein L3 [Candidatus Liptonbacteria bacterium]|nr:50S ribosomal protein L3 [Candidatus Liptonbacteria bacterium]